MQQLVNILKGLKNPAEYVITVCAIRRPKWRKVSGNIEKKRVQKDSAISESSISEFIPYRLLLKISLLFFRRFEIRESGTP
jgi:hypothetical protein